MLSRVTCFRNFASLIDRYGHVPNGNRSYYASRSQPPFFSSMVELIAAREGDKVLCRLSPGTAGRIRLLDGGRRETRVLVRPTGTRFAFRMALCSIVIGMIALPLATNLSRGHRDRAPGDPTGGGSL